MYSDVILFGMQGSGKGTQGIFLKEKYGYKVFDTGSALRSIAQSNSPLGEKVHTIMQKGMLVPTEVVMEVIEDFINNTDSTTPIVFDGIPRSKEQKTQFDLLMKKVNRSPKALFITLSRELAEKRLLKRKICTRCKKIFGGDFKENICDSCEGNLETRSDDNPEAIKKRIDVFFDETAPIIEEYKKDNNYIEIDGEPPIEKVSTLIKRTLHLHD